MDDLQQCAQRFDNLTQYKYRIIIGRKGETYEVCLVFKRAEFHHLAGLHKLRNNLMLQRERHTIVFKKILDGEFSMQNIKDEDGFSLIEKRIKHLCNLEAFLDSNELVFRFNRRRALPTEIKADFVMQNEVDHIIAYLFLAKRKESSEYVCKSFFPKGKKDYTKGQERFTLLYKEKINMKTGEAVVQYDKLSPKG